MEHWLEGVYREHAPALFRFLMRLTGHEAETRDVMQEIFVKLARAPGMLDGVAAPRSYLFRLAHRLVIDRLRREESRHNASQRAALEAETAFSPELDGGEAAGRQRHVAKCLHALPVEQKAVVVLKVWEELTFAEIATVLEISPNTAASRYRYALDKLRVTLRPLHRDLS